MCGHRKNGIFINTDTRHLPGAVFVCYEYQKHKMYGVNGYISMRNATGISCVSIRMEIQRLLLAFSCVNKHLPV